MHIALAGLPLAGKTTLLALLADTAGARMRAGTVVVPSGPWKGIEANRLDLEVVHDGKSIAFSTIPGAAPEELVVPFNAAAERVVFVFDCRRYRSEDQVELWNELASHWRSGPAAYVMNRRKEADMTADEVLRSVGAASSRPFIELSVTDPAEGPRLRDFLFALVAGPTMQA